MEDLTTSFWNDSGDLISNSTTDPSGHAPTTDPRLWMFYKVVMSSLFVLGLTGTLISALIWLQRRMRINNSSAIYLAALSINDFICLCFYIPSYKSVNTTPLNLGNIYACNAFTFFSVLPYILSPLLVLGLTVDRYIAICHPFRRKTMCRPSRAVKVVAGLAAGSFGITSIYVYIMSFDNDCKYKKEIEVQIFLYSIDYALNGFVPLVILVINVMVIHRMQLARKQRDNDRAKSVKNDQKSSKFHASTAMLLAVSFPLIISSIISFIYQVLVSCSALKRHTLEERIVYTISKMFFIFNTASNFIFFVVMSRHFRQCLVDLLRCKTSLQEYQLEKKGGSGIEFHEQSTHP